MPNIRLLLLPMVLKQLLVFGFRFLLNDLQHCKQQQQEGCMGLGWGGDGVAMGSQPWAWQSVLLLRCKYISKHLHVLKYLNQ